MIKFFNDKRCRPSEAERRTTGDKYRPRTSIRCHTEGSRGEIGSSQEQGTATGTGKDLGRNGTCIGGPHQKGGTG